MYIEIRSGSISFVVNFQLYQNPLLSDTILSTILYSCAGCFVKLTGKGGFFGGEKKGKKKFTETNPSQTPPPHLLTPLYSLISLIKISTFVLTLCVTQRVSITARLVSKQLVEVNVGKSMEGLDAQ